MKAMQVTKKLATHLIGQFSEILDGPSIMSESKVNIKQKS